MLIKSVISNKEGVSVVTADGTGFHWDSLNALKLAIDDALSRDEMHQVLLQFGETLKTDANLADMSVFSDALIEGAK